MIHAGAESVIKVPAGCLDTVGAGSRQMRLFEYEAHEVLRSRTVRLPEKRRLVSELLKKFGFVH